MAKHTWSTDDQYRRETSSIIIRIVQFIDSLACPSYSTFASLAERSQSQCSTSCRASFRFDAHDSLSATTNTSDQMDQTASVQFAHGTPCSFARLRFIHSYTDLVVHLYFPYLCPGILSHDSDGWKCHGVQNHLRSLVSIRCCWSQHRLSQSEIILCHGSLHAIQNHSDSHDVNRKTSRFTSIDERSREDRIQCTHLTWTLATLSSRWTSDHFNTPLVIPVPTAEGQTQEYRCESTQSTTLRDWASQTECTMQNDSRSLLEFSRVKQ